MPLTSSPMVMQVGNRSCSMLFTCAGVIQACSWNGFRLLRGAVGAGVKHVEEMEWPNTCHLLATGSLILAADILILVIGSACDQQLDTFNWQLDTCSWQPSAHQHEVHDGISVGVEAKVLLVVACEGVAEAVVVVHHRGHTIKAVACQG